MQEAENGFVVEAVFWDQGLAGRELQEFTLKPFIYFFMQP